ncbi:hypothetical protein DD238_001083 [Peronospora effusa]|uniref:Uncharacterized protein n=1 Tax=Peronospora effusa TaxID=542832 RepID=A0A3M6VLB7_9STRA|nr:hypothetical protein DD238_001083 [Peronospora effusa]
MELTLQSADVLWLAQPLEKQTGILHGPLASHLTVLLPSAKDQDVEVSLPCNISIPPEELTTENKTSLLDQHVKFKLLDGVEIVATHVMKLRECIPVLTEGSVHWTQPVLHKDMMWNVEICIYVKTDRRPRALISRAIAVKNGARNVAQKLSLNKKKLVVGLLPAVVSCVLGALGTSPIWLPLTLLVGVMGFPIWFVASFAMSLVTVFAAISAVLALKVVRSERVKGACQHFLTSQQGQLLLFQGMPGEEALSPSVLSERAKKFVLESPSRKLVASLVIDFVGNATFVVPVIGELADIFWAPVSSRMVHTLYKESSPHARYLGFLEEVLPFTDIIPTATLAWMKENLSTSELRKMLTLTKSRKQE